MTHPMFISNLLAGASYLEQDALIASKLQAYLQTSKPAAYDPERAAERFQETVPPEGPSSLEAYVQELFDKVIAQAARVHSPRYIGHMTTALPDFVHGIGRILTVLNQNVVKLETSNAFTQLERQTLAMLHRLIFRREGAFYATHTQAPESTLGVMVSGGTLGNVTGLWCARNRLSRQHRPSLSPASSGIAEVMHKGNWRRAVVVGSSLMHYSMRKAADLLGIGEQGLLRVPVGPMGKVSPEEVRKTLERCRLEGDCVLALVGIAGTTETGSVDPLADLAALAQEFGTHFHVDAAWGGAMLLSRTHQRRLHGIERADSVVIDGHKQLYLPMGVGMVLFRDPDAAQTIEKSANYIIRSGSHDLGRRSLEGSRPATSLYVHATLHIMGRQGIEALVDDSMRRAQLFADKIRRHPAFELLMQPDLNIVNYRYIPVAYRRAVRAGHLIPQDNEEINTFNIRLQEAQRDQGEGFVSRTLLENTPWSRHPAIVTLRVVLANPLVTPETLDAVLEEQLELAHRFELEEGTLYSLFERQARRTPEDVALIDERGQHVSYRALLARVEHVSDFLMRHRMGGNIIALCMARSVELIVGILAAWRSGAAYLPLDPAYPPERIAFMLEDSRAAVVLTSQQTQDRLPHERATTFAIEDIEALPPHVPPLPGEQVGAGDLAYVIYTSGSTGRPKGVMGTHRGMLNRARWMWDAFPFAAAEVACLKTSPSFVDFIWEFVGPLLQGVPSVIVPRECLGDLQRFVAYLAEYRVSRIVLVPSLLKALLESFPDLGLRLPALELWTSSGEALPSELGRLFQKRVPHAHLLNLYGSSEVAADVSSYLLSPGQSLPAGATVPIGRALPNTQLLLLGENGELVQEGEEGEIYVAGVQLAQGYLHRPDLTAERFITDERRQERYFKTGDRARQLSDGHFVYLGRVDHQLKIRGVRIEPGEIEGALRRIAGVQDVVVTGCSPAGTASAPLALVAYVVRRVPSVSALVLKRRLRQTLPEHLIPDIIMFLDRIPLTPSGKTDRSALPTPSPGHASSPETETECALASIWAEVLGGSEVGRESNFFDLGGNSLAAARLAVHIQQHFGKQVPARLIYDHPVLMQAARVIAEGMCEKDNPAGDARRKSMDSDAQLEASLTPAAFQNASPDGAVFLTGASGYLGIFLLHELVRTSERPVLCLVRAASADAGWQRICEQLAYYGLPEAKIKSRLTMIPGDLARERFGLSQSAFARLAHQTQAILHAGANVHFYHPYEVLAPTNVEGTREVLRLACYTGRREVHYVSTLAVADTHGTSGTHVLESFQPTSDDPPLTGYAQSKWVGERLLWQAQRRGLPVSCYRCDDIAGQSRTGQGNPRDFLWQWVRACVAMQCAPDVDMPLYMIPVDVVAKAIVCCMTQGLARNETLHLHNPQPTSWQRLLDALSICGHAVQRIPLADWLLLAEQRLAAGDSLVSGIAGVLLDRVPGTEVSLLESALAGRRATYDDHHAVRALQSGCMQISAVDTAMLERYCRAALEQGPHPTRVSPVAYWTSERMMCRLQPKVA